MTNTFVFHDLETTPEASKELLSRLFAESARNADVVHTRISYISLN